MRYLKYLALLAVLALPLTYSQAQVDAGVAAGTNQGQADQNYDQGRANQNYDRGHADQDYDQYADQAYVNGPPVCPYGYYSYYPYACAPYGFYGPRWFAGGVFIGAGPWYHWGWGHAGYWGRGFYERPGWGYGRGYVRGYARGYTGRAYHGGGVVRGGGGFHGASGFHGGSGGHGGHR
jgi:hypothetical protein